MHYIQKHILDELRTVKTMRYTQLNTDEIESGHFRYHLGQLVKDGHVEQLERGLYALTTKGQQFVDKLSEHRVNPLPMPKVITYTLLKDGQKVLLQNKPKQPYMGLLNMIGGKLHEGETAQAAAIREVHEKTGATITSPALAGIFEILISSDDYLLTHAIAYVFVAHVEAAAFTTKALSLIHINDLFARNDLAPDLLPLFTKIQAGSSICVDTLEIHI